MRALREAALTYAVAIASPPRDQDDSSASAANQALGRAADAYAAPRLTALLRSFEALLDRWPDLEVADCQRARDAIARAREGK